MIRRLGVLSCVSLPKEVCEHLELLPGDCVEFIPLENGVLLCKTKEEEPVFCDRKTPIKPSLFD